MSFLRRLARLFLTSSERAYMDACEERPALSDAEFHQRYYADSGVTAGLCAGVRRVLCEQLGVRNVLPDDNVALIFDVDISDILFELGEEFGVAFGDDMYEDINGTVDSLIQATNALLNHESCD